MGIKKELNEIGFVGTTATKIVENKDRRKTIIKTIILHNTDTNTGNTVNVKLYVVGNGGTPQASNQFVNQDPAGKDTLFVEIPRTGIVMSEAGKALYAIADAANKVTIQCFGEIE